MVTASLLALATVAVAPVARGRRHLGTVVNDLGSEGGYDDGVATTTHPRSYCWQAAMPADR